MSMLVAFVLFVPYQSGKAGLLRLLFVELKVLENENKQSLRDAITKYGKRREKNNVKAYVLLLVAELKLHCLVPLHCVGICTRDRM